MLLVLRFLLSTEVKPGLTGLVSVLIHEPGTHVSRVVVVAWSLLYFKEFFLWFSSLHKINTWILAVICGQTWPC